MTSESDPETPDRRAGAPRWLGIVLAGCVVVAAVGLFALHERNSAELRTCADVGLAGPSAPTPEAALDAFLNQRNPRTGAVPAAPVDPSAWHRTYTSARGVIFEIGEDPPANVGLHEVTVSQAADNQWSASAGCA